MTRSALLVLLAFSLGACSLFGEPPKVYKTLCEIDPLRPSRLDSEYTQRWADDFQAIYLKHCPGGKFLTRKKKA